MDLYRTIYFSFTHHEYVFTLTLDYSKKNVSIDISKSLHTKIKEECEKLNIIVYEDNLKLYDIENNIKINNYDDLLEYNTQKCRIIIVPINLD
jgi:hypothetical protein